MRRLSFSTCRAWALCAALFTPLACADGDATAPMSRCPPAVAEFPPDGCGILTGRVTWANGAPGANLGIGVDTTLADRGFWLGVRGAQTDADGRFTIVVNVAAPLGRSPDLSPVTVLVVVEGRVWAGDPFAMWRHRVPVTFPLAERGDRVVRAQLSVRLPWNRGPGHW